MKTIPRFLALLAMVAAPLQAAPPVVSNLTASQRTGTKLVDITYSVTADTPTVTTTLQISADGGVSWAVPAATVTGAVGANIATGTGKVITWNAGTDWNEQQSGQMRFRVTAIDLMSDPTPAGIVRIPAGTFTLGDSLDGVADAPTRTVTLSTFYMGSRMVAKSEWDAVRGWGATHGYTDLAVGDGKAGNHPAQNVSWWDVVKWCNARSEMEGLSPCYTVSGAVMKSGTTLPAVNWVATGYRLPTEAEWEKAARGGLSGKRFPWGDTISHSQANYYSDTLGHSYDVSPTRGYHPTYGAEGTVVPCTAPVGSFPANGYGLFDFSGNLFQWCWDWYGAYASGSQTDPRGASTGTARILRGGCWYFDAYYCRTANRLTSDPNTGHGTFSYRGYGFRVVRGLVPPLTGEAATNNLETDTRSVILTLTSAPTGQGLIQGAGSYAINATVSVSATPSPGYLFTGWTGDATGADNPLSVLMNADKTITANFTPDTNDGDGDGWTNYQEIVEYGTNPTLWDTDGDGVKDSVDGRPLDPTETLDTDHDGTGDNADPDDDGDGLPDLDELTIYGTNPKRADSDGDGITDPDELQVYQTNPIVADMDNDDLSDGAEVFTHHTNPKVGDTDGDGFLDGYEVLTGHLPLVATDKPALVADARTAIEFTFPAAIGKTYRIEGSFDLTTWTTVEDGIPGNGAVIQRFYTTRNMPKRYFRVEEGAGP